MWYLDDRVLPFISSHQNQAPVLVPAVVTVVERAVIMAVAERPLLPVAPHRPAVLRPAELHPSHQFDGCCQHSFLLFDRILITPSLIHSLIPFAHHCFTNFPPSTHCC